MRRIKLWTALLLAAVSLFLCGCSGGSIDQYFSLPQPAEEYLQLQQLIDTEIAAGSEYAAPIGGGNRQSVQLADLNRDGRDEALAFLRSSGDKAFINIYEPGDSAYRHVLTIQSEASAIGSIEYADLNGDGIRDLIVAWQMGTALRLLAVYDMNGWGGDTLLVAACTEFLVSDLNGDGDSELLVITREGESGGSVSRYTFPANEEPSVTTARLSSEVTKLERIRECRAEGNVPALLVESFCSDESLVSDLFALRRGELANITLNPATGESSTRRTYAVYASDIDNDHCIEIPTPTSLFTQRDSASFWSIAWNGFDINGRSVEKMDTYHCYSDGWYFVLPEGWHDTLTVRREDSVSGERSVILSEVNRATGEITDKLVIYTLTGENRDERARMEDRFEVLRDESTIYAARILSGITQEEVCTRFNIIYTEWSTGAL